MLRLLLYRDLPSFRLSDQYEVSHATTGSSAKISAALVGEVYC